MIRRIAERREVPARFWSVSNESLGRVGKVGDGLARLVRVPVPFDSYAVKRLCDSFQVDDRAIRNDTGWDPPYSVMEGLDRTVGGSRPTGSEQWAPTHEDSDH